MLSPLRSDPPQGQRDADSERSDRSDCIGGRYEVEEVVGRGGMGAVFRVLDARTGQRLALKRLGVRNRHQDDALRLFEREYHTLAQLRHPRIIAVHDYGVDALGAYYTMELVPGADMRTLAPLPWPLVCKYMREVATSLALLHARKLVHRDVSPQNVRVGEDGHCKLIDFGALADFGASGEVIGTPPCVPPEAIEGKPIDQRVDLYALGCLGYWMLTGRHAYPAADTRQLRAFWARTVPAPSVGQPQQGEGGLALPEIPQELDALVMSLLSLDPMARPSSAGAVIDRLDVLLRTGCAPGSSIPPEDVSLPDSYLASAPLCGRKQELRALRYALERSMRGRGSMLLFEGPKGVGRSRLLAEGALRAKLAGFAVAHVDAAAYAGPLDAVHALFTELSGAPLEVDAGASRLREQLLALTRRRPLALVIDDVHRLDELALRALSGLAHDARRAPILIIGALRTADEPLAQSALSLLQQLATRQMVADLSLAGLEQWLSSVLGDAPNLGRLVSDLHARTSGRPAAVTAHLRWLIERGELRYREGVWVLPSEPSRLELPQHADASLLERLQALPDASRELAQALAVHRGAGTRTLCALLVGSAADAAIEQLVEGDVLVQHGNSFGYASEAVRERVVSELPDATVIDLHMRLSQALLALPAREQRACKPVEQLAAAVHRLEARDVSGVPLATQAALALWEEPSGLSAAVRLLERALELSRPLGISALGRLVLLAPLGLGAYLVDHRLARHEAELTRTFDEVSGMHWVRRWSAWLQRFGRTGARVGTALGLLTVALWCPLRRRGLGAEDPRLGRFSMVASLGVSALVALAGRAAICLDRAAVARALACFRPLEVLGSRQSGAFAVAYCEGLLLASEDRYERTYQHWIKLERRLMRPGAYPDVRGAQRSMWVGGIAYVLGLFEGFRGDAQALKRAEQLEQSDSSLHRMIAAQIRLQYHGFRGEAEQVRRAFAHMESCAIEVGSSWQVETWSAIAINLFGAFWHDIIIAKRAMRETQRMVPELPSLERYAITSEALYLLRRGQPRDCADLYEPLLATEAPLSRIGWSVSSGLLAEAYNMLGMHKQAKELCERVLAVVDAEDRPYYAMRIAVEVPYALACAALGEVEHARQYLADLLVCYQTSGSPAALGTVHEALARIELAELEQGRGERKRFTEHLKQVEACFTKLGNPALIARFQSLSDVAGQGSGILTKVALSRELQAFDRAIGAITDRGEGARAILAWLMHSAEGYEGYLFASADEVTREEHEGTELSQLPAVLTDEPVLLASTSDREPAVAIFTQVDEALRALGSDADTTNFGTCAATGTSGDGSSSHLFLLSYIEADDFRAEGALVLLGRSPHAPPVRYELLQAAALQLRRLLRGEAR